MDDIEINIHDEIVSFGNDHCLDKCLIYTFTSFLVIFFGLFLFIIILMIYNYIMSVFM
jgi:hypothetical protein